MRSSSYLSTSQTAQMLGLSVGTIQRMVESGALKAYTTQGGHRRILASSIRSYCQAHGVPSLHPLPATPGACIIHPSGLDPALRHALETMPNVHLISHPLELAGLADDEPAFFVDARVTWLDWPNLQRPAGLSPTARFIVYNGAQLPPEQQMALSRHALIYPGDISVDLVTGFLLGMSNSDTIQVTPGDTH